MFHVLEASYTSKLLPKLMLLWYLDFPLMEQMCQRRPGKKKRTVGGQGCPHPSYITEPLWISACQNPKVWRHVWLWESCKLSLFDMWEHPCRSTGRIEWMPWAALLWHLLSRRAYMLWMWELHVKTCSNHPNKSRHKRRRRRRRKTVKKRRRRRKMCLLCVQISEQKRSLDLVLE